MLHFDSYLTLQAAHSKRERHQSHHRRQRTDGSEQINTWRATQVPEPAHLRPSSAGGGVSVANVAGIANVVDDKLLSGRAERHISDIANEVDDELLSDGEEQHAADVANEARGEVQADELPELPDVGEHVTVATVQHVQQLFETELLKLSPRDQRGRILCNLATIDQLLDTDGKTESVTVPAVSSLKHGQLDFCSEHKCKMVYNFPTSEIRFIFQDCITNRVTHRIRIPFELIANHVHDIVQNASAQDVSRIRIRVRCAGAQVESHTRENSKSTYSVLEGVPPLGTSLAKYAVYCVETNNKMCDFDQLVAAQCFAAHGIGSDADDSSLSCATEIPADAETPLGYGLSSKWPELPIVVCKELVLVAIRQLLHYAKILREKWQVDKLVCCFQAVLTAATKTWELLVGHAVAVTACARIDSDCMRALNITACAQ